MAFLVASVALSEGYEEKFQLIQFHRKLLKL